MENVFFYSVLSVFLVSLISFIGIFTLSIKADKLKNILIYLLSFSAGALFGDAFMHLLPEVVEETGFGVQAGLSVILGILVFFVLEKFIHWQHCHMPISKSHVHSFAYMNLVGDGLHNLIDGMIIGASYLVDVPTGIATTLAVLFHEIPQEIGDFGVLLHGGFSKTKALMLNFMTALTAFLGAFLALWFGSLSEGIVNILVPMAAGGFIYIAGSDLIPELHKETKVSRSMVQLLAFLTGVGIMLLLILLE